MNNIYKKEHLQEVEDSCTKLAEPLVGKTIKKVRYMTEQEADNMYWSKRPLVIHFTDGSFLIPQADDEANDGGALWYQKSDLDLTIPVI